MSVIVSLRMADFPQGAAIMSGGGALLALLGSASRVDARTIITALVSACFFAWLFIQPPQRRVLSCESLDLDTLVQTSRPLAKFFLMPAGTERVKQYTQMSRALRENCPARCKIQCEALQTYLSLNKNPPE